MPAGLHHSSAPSSVLEALAHWAEQRSSSRVYTFLIDGEREGNTLTFGQLDSRVCNLAGQLAAKYEPGERVLLLYPQCLEFLTAFLACLKSGVVPVPVSIPERRQALEVVDSLAKDCGALGIFTCTATFEKLQRSAAKYTQLAALEVVDTQRLEVQQGAPMTSLPAISGDSLALLQYTSGSTGSPRGVMVSHDNLTANFRELSRSFDAGPEPVNLSWLPMFHDMGLVSVLWCLWSGFHCYLMAPRAFVQKPLRWLSAISKYGVTITGGPDFAYALCCQRVVGAEKAALNLSSWKVAFNGSEPVNSNTLQAFGRHFQNSRFSLNAFHPVYGLAEATLFVSSGRPRTEFRIQYFDQKELSLHQGRRVAQDQGVPLVSLGTTWLDASVLVVDPESLSPCAEGKIGEVWVGGPSVAQGYWQDEELSEKVFRAQLNSGRGPYLRTGDLGFSDRGELYVTGRLKDLIIIRGINHYPQDIEVTVSNSHSALSPLGGAAFSVVGPTGEQLVVVCELQRTAMRTVRAAEVFRAIRSAVAERHGLNTRAIVLLRPASLPRTTSGKVRRKICRELFLTQEFKSVASWQSEEALRESDSSELAPDSVAESRRGEVIEWLRERSKQLSATSRTGRAQLFRESLDLLSRRGLLGLCTWPEYGGLGLSQADSCSVLSQLGALNLGVAIFVASANSLGARPIQEFAHPALRRSLLPQLAGGGCRIGTFAFEPSDLMCEAKHEHAADVLARDCRWRLQNKYSWTGLGQASVALSLLVDLPGDSEPTAFCVQPGPVGITEYCGEGAEPSPQLCRHSISLNGVVVAQEDRLGAAGQGREIAFDALAHLHLSIGALCVGGLKRIAQLAVNHASQAKALEDGRSLLVQPVTLARLGPITASVESLECLVQLIARTMDAGRFVPRCVLAVGKMAGPEFLWRSADDLVHILGGPRGAALSPDVSGIVESSRMLRMFQGSSEEAAVTVGQTVLENSDELRDFLQNEMAAHRMVPLLDHALQAVRVRSLQRTEAPGGDPGRWAALRAGNLVMWSLLIAATERQRRHSESPSVGRAAAWAQASFERVLSSVQGGTPSETIALGPAAIANAVASYSEGIGDLGDPESSIPKPANQPVRKRSTWEVREWIVGWLAIHLRVDERQIDPDRSFADHGIDSMLAVQFAQALSDKLQTPLDETVLWNFSTINQLVEYLVQAATAQVQPADSHSTNLPPSLRAAQQAESAISEQLSDQSSEELEDELAQLERELSRGSS